jgi:hypothetical protein
MRPCLHDDPVDLALPHLFSVDLPMWHTREDVEGWLGWLDGQPCA